MGPKLCIRLPDYPDPLPDSYGTWECQRYEGHAGACKWLIDHAPREEARASTRAPAHSDHRA